MSETHTIELETTPKGGVFYVEVSGERVARILWDRIPEGMDIRSTSADESMRGTGIARKLVAEAVAHARKEDWNIRATCPYANKVISGDDATASLLID